MRSMQSCSGEDEGVGRVHDGRAEELADGVEVVCRSRHDVAGAVALEELGWLFGEVSEEVVTEVELDLAGGADDDLSGEIEGHGGDDRDAEQDERLVDDLVGVEAVLHVGDGVADDQGDQCLRTVIDEQGEEAEGEAAPVASEVGEEGAEAGKHKE
jgi:hypothetical protein